MFTLKAKFFRLSHNVVACDVDATYITHDYIVRQTKNLAFIVIPPMNSHNLFYEIHHLSPTSSVQRAFTPLRTLYNNELKSIVGLAIQRD